MFSKILLVAAMSVGVAACVGDVPDDNGGGGGSGSGSDTSNAGGTSTGAQLAKKSYDDNVYPIVSATCGGCHGGGGTNPTFVGADKNSAYTAIVDYSQLVGSWTPETAGVLNGPGDPGALWRPRLHPDGERRDLGVALARVDVARHRRWHHHAAGRRDPGRGVDSPHQGLPGLHVAGGVHRPAGREQDGEPAERRRQL
ncbi:MAG: hypothetical protein HC863_00675 [Myxococcales bacterium]|nr:hypothetical protein [Myxococcales bacterium]